MRVGVLALQGAVREHLQLLEKANVEAVPVKRREEIDELDGIVLPGGESTTIGKLLVKYDMLEPLRVKIQSGLPAFGTCAGLILLANRIVGQDAVHLGVMDIKVERNSFGRQRESFETDLAVPVLGDQPYPAIFIRAPHIVSVGTDVEVLAEYEGRIVMARQKNILTASFHPELTDDYRLHEYFAEMVTSFRTTVV